MHHTSLKLSLASIMLLGFAFQGVSQDKKKEGKIDNSEVNVTKEQKKVIVPPPVRKLEKMVTPPNTVPRPPLRFLFSEVPNNGRITEISNQVQMPVNPVTPVQLSKYNNVIRAGFGNFGHTYLEGHAGIAVGQENYHGIYVKHNAYRLGPIGANYSGESDNQIKAHSRTQFNSVKLEGSLGWKRKGFYYYGYQPKVYSFDKETIFNSWNKFNFDGTVSNTSKTSPIDYVFRSKLSYLFTKVGANELLWDAGMSASFPLTDKLSANFDGQMVLAQSQDSLTTYRNLYKLVPNFKYKDELFSVTLGVMLANSKEKTTENETYVLPVLKADYQLMDGIKLYAGYEGDVMANNLTTILQENQWLGRFQSLKPTRKLSDIYAGVKANLYGGLSGELQGSYATYKNFYVLNNSRTDSTKFEILYSNDTTKVHVTSLSGQINYEIPQLFRSSLLMDYYIYSNLGNLKEAWHRPAFKATWSNQYLIREKMLVTSDFYVLTGLKGLNGQTNQQVTLNPIFDLNLKFTFFISERFDVFLSANNILNKNYQRYLYYPVQGANFLAGLSFSF
ncbi:TonB-dependent receptor [Flectobacillus sp. BAB-3569]|uniref:TonB-dependent receptor n=1 Tax=Flectobacillus sp. BAB-3569 TaxID=1509483 RepID=UPI0011406322|nr:TonB-dependent receptor [Flectobacillus sp. BAB-3569]